MKKFKNDKKKLAIFFFIFFSFLAFPLEIPRKTYNILTLNYEKRLTKSYDFCSERAVGFLLYIKKKYKINYPLKFIKYTGVRNPNWIFFDRSIDTSSNLYVLINYNNDQEIFLEEIGNNKFKYNFDYSFNHRQFKKIIINSEKNLDLDELKIFNGEKVLFNFEDLKKNMIPKLKRIEIDINEELNDILKNNQKNEKNFFLEISNTQNDSDLKSKIIIELEHIIDLINYEIIENIGGCYLVKKND